MNKPCYIFDSYALLCFFKKEPGFQEVKEILKQAEKEENDIFLCTVNLAEVYYNTYRYYGVEIADEALSLVTTFKIHIVPADIPLSIAAAKEKANHPIALGDCFTVALTKQKGGKAVTGDPEFKAVEKEIEIFWLPANVAQI